jgi:hypothetical protein
MIERKCDRLEFDWCSAAIGSKKVMMGCSIVKEKLTSI